MNFNDLVQLIEAKKITFEDLYKKYFPRMDKMKEEFAYEYAKDVLKKRWVDAPEIPIEEARKAEKLISGEQHYAARYAIDIMKQRWIEAPNVPKDVAIQAENNIIESDDHWEWNPLFDYIKYLIKGRWPEAESERCVIGQAIRDLSANNYSDPQSKMWGEEIVQRYIDILKEEGLKPEGSDVPEER